MRALPRFRHEITNLLRFFRDLFQWIILRPSFVWVTILVPFLALAFAIYEDTEPACRLVGLLLQSAGTATVIWNIRDTRRQFQRPSLLRVVREWFRGRPRLHPSVTLIAGAGTVALTGARGRLEAWQVVPDGADIEVRIETLEKNQNRLRDRIHEFVQQTEQDLEHHNLALDQEKQDRADGDRAIQEKLETAQTGGLHISIMGVVWLFVGMAMSGASVELAAWFARSS